MASLDKILDQAMDLPLEQQEMLIKILQSRVVEKRRVEIAQDAVTSLAEFRTGKLKTQTADEAIAALRQLLQHDNQV